jgi:putative endonuclease
MSGGNSARGRRGEALAARELERRGYSIVERNWRCEAGEIDLVAREGETWAFVEVKLRTGRAYGLPEEAITHRKRDRLLNAALMYLAERDLTDVIWRIDVVAIVTERGGGVERFSLYRDAVRFDG